MKFSKKYSLIWLTIFLIAISSGCRDFQSEAKIQQTNIIPTPTVENNLDAEVKNGEIENSSECVRAVPEPIVVKEVFSKTTFRLEKSKEFPFEYLGYETIEFENGDKLLIENVGCENFTLNFRFEIGDVSGKNNDVRFWYRKSAELIERTMKGLTKANLIKDQVKALNSYINKNKTLKFNEEIEVETNGINENVYLEKVTRLKNNRVEIVLSFNIGPL